jgi:putative alpha-1,2-mannosidase
MGGVALEQGTVATRVRRRASTLAALTAVTLTSAAPAGAQAAPDPTRHVDPFVGTRSGAQDFGTVGGAGNTFPGAVVPFGMAQFSPDTVPSSDNFAGGYSQDAGRPVTPAFASLLVFQ